jgi:hypothetical protein
VTAILSGTAEHFRNSNRPASNLPVFKNHETAEAIYCCGGGEVAKGGDGPGDEAPTVAHAIKGGDGEEETDADAAAALPHAVAPVGAPSVYCCGGGRNVYCCGGTEESKGRNGEEEKDGDA